MAAMPMLAGVGLMMVCCSSSSAAAMMMGGETIEETKPTTPTPTGPVLPKAQYVKIARPTGTYPLLLYST